MSKGINSNWEYRRELIHQRLKEAGMENYSITYLPYLDETKWDYIEPTKVGKRIIILYGVAFAAFNQEEKDKIIAWFKKENLWNEAAQSEQDFLLETNSTEQICAAFTWRLEGAYILAWAVKLIQEKPVSDQQCDVEKLKEVLPMLGASIAGFLENLDLRSYQQIFDENVFNELATSYLRDCWISGKENTNRLHPAATYERHYALNCLRQYNQTDHWDDVSTDT